MFLYLARVIIWLPENPTAHEGLIHVYGYIFKHAGNCASVFQLFQMLVSKSQLAHSEDMKLSCAESKHSFCSVFSHDEKNSAVMKNVDRHHPQWCRNDDPCRELFSKRGEKYSGEWVHLGNLAYTVAWCKCTMMHHSEDCTDGASSWTVGVCRLHQSVTGVSGSVVWGGLHKEAGVIASALISCQDTHLLWICIYTQ